MAIILSSGLLCQASGRGGEDKFLAGLPTYLPPLLLMPKLLPATATTSTTEIPMSITLTAHYLPTTATTAPNSTCHLL